MSLIKLTVFDFAASVKVIQLQPFMHFFCAIVLQTYGLSPLNGFQYNHVTGIFFNCNQHQLKLVFSLEMFYSVAVLVVVEMTARIVLKLFMYFVI